MPMAAPTTARAASTKQSEAESLSLTCPDWPAAATTSTECGGSPSNSPASPTRRNPSPPTSMRQHPQKEGVAMAFVGRTYVKDPGAGQHQWERLARRREGLYADD